MYFTITSISAVVLITIASGLYLLFNNTDTSKEKIRKALKINLTAFIPLVALGIFLVTPNAVLAAGEAGTTASGLGYIAMAISTGLATIGAGYAVGHCGSAALGAVSEDPKIIGKTMIFVGMAEGISIVGLIVSILIMVRL